MGNNPVSHNDPTGHCFDGVTTAICLTIAVGAIAGGVGSAASYIAATKASGEEIDTKSLLVATGAGLVSGGLITAVAIFAPAAALPAAAAINASVNATAYIIDRGIHDDPVKLTVDDAVNVTTQAGIGALLTPIGGNPGTSRWATSAVTSFERRFANETTKEVTRQFTQHLAENFVSSSFRSFGTSFVSKKFGPQLEKMFNGRWKPFKDDRYE